MFDDLFSLKGRVALVSGGRINLPELNTFYGTAIESNECEIVELPLPWPLAKAEWGAALRGAFVNRSMRRHLNRFDVLISAYNIVDFGRPAFIIWPISHGTRPCVDTTIRRLRDCEECCTPTGNCDKGIWH